MVLSYQGRELLERVLPSIFGQTHESYRVIVVDNGSTDGSVEYLGEHWPEAKVVAIPENVGVTAALNACVRAADAEFVALLNNDVELEPEWLSEMVRGLVAHPEAASANGKLRHYYERHLLDGAGDSVAWRGEAVRRGQGEPDRGQYDDPEPVFSSSAAAALYRREAFEVVGPFDEAFWSWLEDVDWGFRAQLAGYTARYVPTAVGYHIGAATLGSNPTAFTLYHLRRNSVWLWVKNAPTRSLLRHLPRLAADHAWMVVLAVRGKHLPSLACAWRDALRGLPGMLRKRREIQKRRRVPNSYLESMVVVGRFEERLPATDRIRFRAV